MFSNITGFDGIRAEPIRHQYDAKLGFTLHEVVYAVDTPTAKDERGQRISDFTDANLAGTRYDTEPPVFLGKFDT